MDTTDLLDDALRGLESKDRARALRSLTALVEALEDDAPLPRVGYVAGGQWGIG